MTARDRAKKAVRFALMLMLLGVFAVSAAQAITIAKPNVLCGAPVSGPGPCDLTQTLTINGATGASGDEYIGVTATPGTPFTASPDADGGVVVLGGFLLTADEPGIYNVLLDLTGAAPGIALGTDGVAGYYDVILSPASLEDTSGVLGTAALFSVTADDLTVFGPEQVSVLGEGHGIGNVHIGPIDPSQIIASWDMQISFDWFALTSGDTLGVDIPLTEDPTPEPVSVLLVGSGIGLLALLRRRRQA